jgi:long-chain fatty acid transport protein
MKTSYLSPIVLFFFTTWSFTAEGVKTIPDSAAALGMIGGRFANLSDPSVTRANPASLLDVEGTNFQFNFQAWHGETNFKQAGTGLRDSMILNWKQTGSLYLTHQISDDVTMGLGISAPFGVAINWPRQGVFRYSVPYDTVLQTIAINPAVAFQINDRLSIGLGADIYHSRLKIEQAYRWFGLPFPDGDLIVEGTGVGLGGYVGMNFQIDEKQRLSIVGRLPVNVEYDGETTITNIPAPFSPLFAPKSNFESDIEHPGSLAVGYGLNLTERTKIGFDFEWIQNSSHDDIPLNIGTNQALLGGNNSQVLSWKDSISTGLGLSHQTTDEITFRAGYLFSESPMNNQFFTPAIPADDRHILSLGLGYQLEKANIDLGYNSIFLSDRHISNNVNPTVNGDYDFFWHILAISYTRSF